MKRIPDKICVKGVTDPREVIRSISPLIKPQEVGYWGLIPIGAGEKLLWERSEAGKIKFIVHDVFTIFGDIERYEDIYEVDLLKTYIEADYTGRYYFSFLVCLFIFEVLFIAIVSVVSIRVILDPDKEAVILLFNEGIKYIKNITRCVRDG